MTDYDHQPERPYPARGPKTVRWFAGRDETPLTDEERELGRREARRILERLRNRGSGEQV